MVDGFGANWLKWCLNASGKCFGPVVVPLVHPGAFLYSGKLTLRHADDSTLVAVVPSTGEKVAVTESPNRDLNMVSVWFDL